MATKSSTVARHFYAKPLRSWWTSNSFNNVELGDLRYQYAIHPAPHLTPKRKFTTVKASTTDVVVLSREQ